MEQVSITSAYMWAAVVTVVFFLTAVVISSLILFKPNNPGTTSRRIWFWLLCVATGVIGFIINYIIASGITVPSIHSSYLTHSSIASMAAVAVYIVSGIIVSKIFSNSKVGTWF